MTGTRTTANMRLDGPVPTGLKSGGESRPYPTLEYQGSALTLSVPGVSAGPFHTASSAHALGHTVAIGSNAGVQEINLRPAAFELAADPCTNVFVMHYRQDIQWEMIFAVKTDPGGGLIGTSFALDVVSTFPDIAMSIGKTEIRQPAFGVLKVNSLPPSYDAQLILRFWDNGKEQLPLDSWVMLEVAYVPNRFFGRDPDGLESLPREPLGRTVLFPASLQTGGGVVGDNYPGSVRRFAGPG